MIHIGLSISQPPLSPQANAILERIHQVLMPMIHTSEMDMADSVAPSDIDAILTNASWVICSTNDTALRASPGKQYLDSICCLIYRS